MLCLKLHAVHWNEDLYSCYEDAAKSNEGIIIIAVFLKVVPSYFNRPIIVRIVDICVISIR